MWMLKAEPGGWEDMHSLMQDELKYKDHILSSNIPWSHRKLQTQVRLVFVNKVFDVEDIPSQTLTVQVIAQNDEDVEIGVKASTEVVELSEQSSLNHVGDQE